MSDLDKLSHLISKLGIDSKKEDILGSYNTVFDNDSLISLDLIGTGITKLEADTFDDFPRIQKIFLSHNSLGTLPNEIFSNLRELIHIDLRGVNLTEIDKDQFQFQFKLKRLELNDNHLTELPKGLFDSLYSLEELNFSNNAIAVLDGDLFNNLGHLHRLYMYFNPLPQDLGTGDYYDRESVEECISKIKRIFS
ncbi:MAG: leucine-rich repeat domain-containing protein [Candidatus Kariarchaeaceae archaeon]|jgi:Leucine-rich repeat (LRR) protein